MAVIVVRDGGGRVKWGLFAALVMGRNGRIEALDQYCLGIEFLLTFVDCIAGILVRRRTSGSRSEEDDFKASVSTESPIAYVKR